MLHNETLTQRQPSSNIVAEL